MQYVETDQELKSFAKILQSDRWIVQLYEVSNKLHTHENQPLAMFFKNIESSDYYCLSFNHPDVLTNSCNLIKLILQTPCLKYVIDRKKLLYYEENLNNCIDLKSCLYFDTFKKLSESLEGRYTDTRSLPITKYSKHFKELCKSVSTYSFDDEILNYEKDLSTALYHIEKNVLYVTNFSLGDTSLLSDDNLVYSQYNSQTPTSRPSNRFGNVNYAALNKKTGERKCFTSRFGNNGTLVMMDFESYHLRLVGNYLNYDLPTSSIHEYLGKLYHGKDELTEEEYDLSKKITFNLIYGGISDDIKKNVPFMNKISEYVDETYKFFVKNSFVKTWFYNRKIKSSFIGDSPNEYKVFNYLLQSAETERNCQIIQKVNKLLEGRKSKFILYTYDAFLFDTHSSEFELMLEIRDTMTSSNKFPVRTYFGKTYDKMKEV